LSFPPAGLRHFQIHEDHLSIQKKAFTTNFAVS
jgi:hypothetical protein